MRHDAFINVYCTTKGAAGKADEGRERGAMFCEEFLGRLPNKPYCTDDLQAGLRVRPLSSALERLYIQLNPPGFQWVMVFDVDHEMRWKEIRSLDLPEWTWRVVNPENGHSHIAYALKVPVCTSDAARPAPLRYLAAIEAAYRRRLNADPLYTGLITKNPERADYWDVRYCDTDGDMAYTLDELADRVRADLKARVKRNRPVGEIAGLGRNCYIFEKVRLWAYTAVREYWSRPGEWYEAVEGRCQAVNVGFETPLYDREVRGIGRSIAGWTWRRFSQEKFSDFQRRNVLLRWERESRKTEGLHLLRAGMSPVDVAEVCGTSPRSAQRWVKEALPERQSITALKPWEVLGVSRSLYYRDYRSRIQS